MSKIGYIQTSVNSYLKTPVEKAIQNLDNAKNIANNIVVPYDFEYRTYSYSINDEINGMLKRLNSVYSMLKNSEKLYDSTEKNLESMITSINNISINTKNTSIR